MNVNRAMAEATTLALQVKLGHLSHNVGKTQAKPLLEIVNKRIAEIAEKSGKKAYKVRWSELIL